MFEQCVYAQLPIAQGGGSLCAARSRLALLLRTEPAIDSTSERGCLATPSQQQAAHLCSCNTSGQMQCSRAPTGSRRTASPLTGAMRSHTEMKILWQEQERETDNGGTVSIESRRQA